jgi:hypothetical protein
MNGEFSGIYTCGFENTTFAPDEPDLGEATVWVELAPWVVPPAIWEESRLLAGPRRYGHMGVAEYRLTVHEILEIKAP